MDEIPYRSRAGSGALDRGHAAAIGSHRARGNRRSRRGCCHAGRGSGRAGTCAAPRAVRRAAPAHLVVLRRVRFQPVAHRSRCRVPLRARRGRRLSRQAGAPPCAARLHGGDRPRRVHGLPEHHRGPADRTVALGFRARVPPAQGNAGTGRADAPDTEEAGRSGGDAGAGRRGRDAVLVAPDDRGREFQLPPGRVHDLHRLRVDRAPGRSLQPASQRDLRRRCGTATVHGHRLAAPRGPLALPRGRACARLRGARDTAQRQCQRRPDVRLERLRRPPHRRGLRATPRVERAAGGDLPGQGSVGDASDAVAERRIRGLRDPGPSGPAAGPARQAARKLRARSARAGTADRAAHWREPVPFRHRSGDGFPQRAGHQRRKCVRAGRRFRSARRAAGARGGELLPRRTQPHGPRSQTHGVGRIDRRLGRGEHA